MGWERRFWVVWAGGLALRLVLGLTLDLTPDEAYYWEYARRPDWSYYDHPPMVGYLIGLGRLLFGDTAVAVRLPSWIGIGLVSWLLFVIGRDHLGNPRTGCLAAAMPHLTPAGLALGFITTPDVPLAVAWTAATTAFLGLLRRPASESGPTPTGTPAIGLADGFSATGATEPDAPAPVITAPAASGPFASSASALAPSAGLSTGSTPVPERPSFEATPGLQPWLLTGLALGLGAMSKYTMIFLVPGIAATLLAFPRLRPRVGSGPFWTMVGLAALGTVPVLIWNLEHDWASLRFQLHHGLKASPRPFSANLGEFLGGQLVTIGPLLLVALWSVGLTRLRAAWRAGDERRFFLAAAGLPMLCFFAFNGMRSKVEANWPQVAYLSLMPLVAEWLGEGPTPRRRTAWVLGTSGLLAALAALQALTLVLPLPVRSDVSTRLHGWTQMGAALRAFDERTEHRFVFVGQGAPLTALVSFYGGLPPDRIAEICGTGQWGYWWQNRTLATGSHLAYVDEGRWSEVGGWLPRFHGPNASESHPLISRGRLLRTITITTLQNSRTPISFRRPDPPSPPPDRSR